MHTLTSFHLRVNRDRRRYHCRIQILIPGLLALSPFLDLVNGLLRQLLSEHTFDNLLFPRSLVADTDQYTTRDVAGD